MVVRFLLVYVFIGIRKQETRFVLRGEVRAIGTFYKCKLRGGDGWRRDGKEGGGRGNGGEAEGGEGGRKKNGGRRK